MKSIFVRNGKERQCNKQIIVFLNKHELDMQTYLLNSTIKSYIAKAVEKLDIANPTMKMWQKLDCNTFLLNNLSEYMKFAQITINIAFN